MVKVLILEDDHEYIEIVHALFVAEAWSVEAVDAPDEALARIRDGLFDLCVVSSRLASGDEYSFCASVRKISTVPIMVLLDPKHAGQTSWFLEEGADGVVGKPFHPRDLLSAARAIIRRVVLCQRTSPTSDELFAHSVRLSPSRRQAMVQGRTVHLAPREFNLLQALMENRGRVLTRSQLATRAWGVEFDGADREVDVYVRRLRNKIESNPQRPEILLTERGFGYRFRR